MFKRLLISIGLIVTLIAATSCDPRNPAHLQAWYDLNPEHGTAVTQETMNEPQKAVVAHLEDQKELLLEAIAQARAAQQRPTDCYSAMEQVWPSHLWSWGRTVIHRESRNIPTAQNPSSSAAGCWQMLQMHAHRFDAVGCSWAQRYDALCNSKAAWHLYQAAGGPSPWRLTSPH